MAVLAEAVLIMTMNIYHEARGEPYAGQLAVADTVMTRVQDTRWPQSVKEVVLQRKQFSWVAEKKIMNLQDLISLQHQILHSKKTKPADIESYRRAESIARKVLKAGYKPSYRFTHFHGTKVNPYWASNRGRWIGRHIFYRK